MKSILVYIILTVFTNDINEIATINRLKEEAEKAYNDGNYQEAIRNYSYLYDSLGYDNDKILLNLSNSYFNAQDTSNAQFHYGKLTDSRDNDIRSVAYQQLGVIANNMGKYDIALEQFKNSLRANPQNNDSRYNFELLKRLMEENQQQQQQNQNQDQQNKDQQQQDQQQQDQQNQEDQNQDQQENEQNQQDQQNQEQQEQQQQEQQQQESESSEEENEEEKAQPQPQDMEEMEISEEMAKMILEAMRNNEIQYIQQNKKKAKKPKDKSKPDW
jgi:hypothetical protein